MFRHELIVQSPQAKGVIAAAVRNLAGEIDFDRIRGIFAFATESGTQELIENLTQGSSGWEKAEKRWLISADFGFTEPRALRALSGLPNSSVRIPDAPYLLRNSLKPRVTHHAKSLILDRQSGKVGDPPVGLLVGSANLTVSALSGNFEAATLAVWRSPLSKLDRTRLTSAESQIKEFDRIWQKALKLDDVLLAKYQRAWKKNRKARPWPDQERRSMVREAGQTYAGSFELAAALRSADKFWIQTGNMYKNLGEDGNQVDMSPGSRVFFGFSNREMSEELLGEIELGYWERAPVGRHLHYGKNSMDKIYLPNPGTEGAPASYVNETLLFERRKNGSFRFKVGTPAETKAWRQASRRQGTIFKMRSGREFGVFR